MSGQAPQAQSLDPERLAHVLAKKLEEKLEELLRSHYGEKAYVGYYMWRAVGREKIIVDLDVDITELLLGERPELRKKSVEFYCGDVVAELPECDQESPSYNEEECFKRFRECEEAELEEFEKRECDIGLKFAVARDLGMGNKLVSWVTTSLDDDLYYYYCNVVLANRVVMRIYDWMRPGEEWAEEWAELLAYKILHVVEAVKGLSEEL